MLKVISRVFSVGLILKITIFSRPY